MRSAFVVVPHDGEVLAVSRGPGAYIYGLPGGAAEDREAAAETALRELQEETGLTACGPLRPVLVQPGRVFFIATCVAGTPRPSPEGDLAWLPWPELVLRGGRWGRLYSRMTPLIVPFLR